MATSGSLATSSTLGPSRSRNARSTAPRGSGLRQVHDRASQIRLEGARVAEEPEPTHEAYERLLDEVLRDSPVAGQQVGEPDASGRRPHVRVAEPAAETRVSIHGRYHPCPIVPHVLLTRERGVLWQPGSSGRTQSFGYDVWVSPGSRASDMTFGCHRARPTAWARQPRRAMDASRISLIHMAPTIGPVQGRWRYPGASRPATRSVRVEIARRATTRPRERSPVRTSDADRQAKDLWVDPRGFEPLTSWLPAKRSTS